jgi:hypothetical protein
MSQFQKIWIPIATFLGVVLLILQVTQAFAENQQLFTGLSILVLLLFFGAGMWSYAFAPSVIPGIPKYRWHWIAKLILIIILISILISVACILAILDVVPGFCVCSPAKTPMPTAIFTPLPNPTEPTTTQPAQVPIGTTYSIRFVGRFVSGSQTPRNVYYYTDGGDKQLLAAIGDSIDKTFKARFARNIRVQVELDAGTTWYEELYVNDKLIAHGNIDNSGFTYQAPAP